MKVFKDEGEDESEQNASECLQAELLEEEKSSLIKESEQVPYQYLYEYLPEYLVEYLPDYLVE